jgi:tetratricopeptide (TPR) repeat protein
MSDVATLTAEKQAATALLQAGQLVKARDAYFAILINIDSEETKSPDPAKVEIKIACLNNLMALFLKTKKYKEVIELSRQVLQLDPQSVKALFRQSQALSELELNNDALLCLQKLLLIEPQNAQAKELRYVVMDKLNPLDDESPPSPPSSPSSMSTQDSSKDGKVYNISRMPSAVTTTTTTTTSTQEEKGGGRGGVEPVPVTFGGGWGFMNPEWTPGEHDNGGSSSSITDQAATVSDKKEKEASQGIYVSPPTAQTATVQNEQKQHEDTEDSAQIFLDEAERTRIKNQLFAEALQKNSSKEVKNIKIKSKMSTSNQQKEVEVDELVSKTVAELSLEEKKLVAKVDAKKTKGTKKSSTKVKKSQEGSVLKKKVVSSKAKT